MHQKNSQYKCLAFLSMLVIVLFVCHTLLQNKYILAAFGLMSVGSLFIPMYNILSDVITEVYGYGISMKIYWTSSFSYLFFDFLCYIILHLPGPYDLEEHNYYNFLLDYALLSICLGILLSAFAYKINAYLLVKWKILLKGKYFWLRSFATTIFSDVIFLSLILPTWSWFGPAVTYKEAIQLSLSSLTLRIIFYCILAFPSTLLVNLLKVVEQTDIYDHEIKFNPFKR